MFCIQSLTQRERVYGQLFFIIITEKMFHFIQQKDISYISQVEEHFNLNWKKSMAHANQFVHLSKYKFTSSSCSCSITQIAFFHSNLLLYMRYYANSTWAMTSAATCCFRSCLTASNKCHWIHASLIFHLKALHKLKLNINGPLVKIIWKSWCRWTKLVIAY